MPRLPVILIAASGARLAWERADKPTAVPDPLPQPPRFGEGAGRTRAGAAGFSPGSYPVSPLAAGRTGPEPFEAFRAGPSRDAACNPQAGSQQADAALERCPASDPAVQPAIRQAGEAFAGPRVTGAAATGSAPRRASAPAATPGGTLAEQMYGLETLARPDATHPVLPNALRAWGQRFVPESKDADGAERSVLHSAGADAALRRPGAALPAA